VEDPGDAAREAYTFFVMYEQVIVGRCASRCSWDSACRSMLWYSLCCYGYLR